MIGGALDGSAQNAGERCCTNLVVDRGQVHVETSERRKRQVSGGPRISDVWRDSERGKSARPLRWRSDRRSRSRANQFDLTAIEDLRESEKHIIALPRAVKMNHPGLRCLRRRPGLPYKSRPPTSVWNTWATYAVNRNGAVSTALKQSDARGFSRNASPADS